MKDADKDSQSFSKVVTKIEDEKEASHRNQLWIHNLIEKEKELRVIYIT